MVSLRVSHHALSTYSQILFLLMAVALSMAGIYRGFDMTDEGGFLLSIAHTDIYRGGVYNYHLIIHRLVPSVFQSIVGLRWSSLILTLLSGLVLSFGTIRVIKTITRNEHVFSGLMVFGFVGIGMMMFYCSGIVVLHNNTMTNAILATSLGILLYLVSLSSFSPVSRSWIIGSALLGSLTALSFFIKFPVGVIQLLLNAVMLVTFFYSQGFRSTLNVLMALFSGVVVGLLAYFILIQPYSVWCLNFAHEIKFLSDHRPSDLINKYLFNLEGFSVISIKYFSWLVVFPFYFGSRFIDEIRFRNPRLRYIELTMLLLAISIIVIELLYLDFHLSPFATPEKRPAFFFVILLGLLMVLNLAVSWKNNQIGMSDFRREANTWLLVLVLCAAPLIGAVGTANSIFLNALCNSAPWFAAILILVARLSNYINPLALYTVFIGFPSIVAISILYDGNLVHPYYSIFNANKSNYFQQTSVVAEYPLLHGVSVDLETANFLKELKIIFDQNGFEVGSSIFGYGIPGIVYLMEGISPGVPWYYNKQRDIEAIRLLELRATSPVFLVLENDELNKELLHEFRTKGINFPEDYSLRGRVYFPNRGNYLKVYFPMYKQAKK